MSIEQGPFPWKWVARRTAQVSAVVAATLASLVAAARAQERREVAEAERFRWTDEARWDR